MPISKEDIDKSFRKPRCHVWQFSPSYGLGLLLSAIGAVVLLSVYLSIIGGLLYAIYVLARHGYIWAMMSMVSIGGIVLLGGIITAVIVALFQVTLRLIAVLFLPDDSPSEVQEVTPLTEPVFCHFVECIAKSLGTKPPTKIILSGANDACIYFGNISEAISGNRRELHLGLSLFPSFSVTALGGIIAHELGHSTQRISLVIRAIVCSITKRFLQAWDSLKIEEMIRSVEHSSEEDSFISYVIERGTSASVRAVLLIFVKFSAILNAFASRKAELHADLFQSKFSGSELALEQFTEYALVDYTLNKVMGECSALQQKGELVDNFPGFVALRRKKLTNQEQKLIGMSIKNIRTNLYSSHPSPSQRINRAKKLKHEGIFQLDQPGTELFANFEKRAKVATFHFYDVECNLEVDQNKLVPLLDFDKECIRMDTAFSDNSSYVKCSGKLFVSLPVVTSQFEWSRQSNSSLASLLFSLCEKRENDKATQQSLEKELQVGLIAQGTLCVGRFLEGHRQPLDINSFLPENATSQNLNEASDELRFEIETIDQKLVEIYKTETEAVITTFNLLSRSGLYKEKARQSTLFEETMHLLKVADCLQRVRSVTKTIDHKRNYLIAHQALAQIAKDNSIGGELIRDVSKTRKQLSQSFSSISWEPSGKTSIEEDLQVTAEKCRSQLPPLDNEILIAGAQLYFLTRLQIDINFRLGEIVDEVARELKSKIAKSMRKVG